MMNRFFLALMLLAGLAQPAWPQSKTQPATQPASQPASQPATHPVTILKLHATAVASDEVDLYWYDNQNLYKRYVVCRSTDGGKTFKPFGSEEGGDKTGPRYEHKDVSAEEDTTYDYLVEAPDKTPISTRVEVRTPQKTLLEAAQGETKLQLKDVASIGFWQATAVAVLEWLKEFLPRLLIGVLVFAIFFVIHHFARKLALGSLKRASVDQTVHELLLGLLRWGILGFGLVIACDQIGIPVTALFTGITITGLAVGFAAQDTLANLIASVLIFWDKPFKVDDWITLNSHYGRVQRVTFRSTRLLKQNGDIVAMPNTMVLGSMLINHSMNPINWVNVPLSIPETLPIDRARKALLATCVGDDRLQIEPAPKVVIDSIAPGAVSIFLSFCIKEEARQSDLLQEYLEKSKNALDALR
jgi:small conductance mechanosensitive channel